MDTESIQKLVERQLAEYHYEVSERAIGNPWPADKVKRQLTALRRALIPPRRQQIELRDTATQINRSEPSIAEYWIVADDDDGYLVFFDPDANEFGLAAKADDASAASIGVRGDLVGVFMAR